MGEKKKTEMINDLKLIFSLDISGTRIDTNQKLLQRVKFHASNLFHSFHHSIYSKLYLFKIFLIRFTINDQKLAFTLHNFNHRNT